MDLINFATSPESLIPPALALTLAIVTRRVLLSLGLGIVLGGLLLTNFQLILASQYLSSEVQAVFIEDGSINAWNMSIVAFLVLLGMMTALLTLSGGTFAFANWAQKHIKTKRGAKLLAAFLGVFIFIDDYFNSLAVGSIARPVTDRYYVSRAKLAYILDSTAAPMCVLMPASSWGAYIMTVISSILVSHGLTNYSPLGAYMALVPMNFYAIFALLMVFAVVCFKIDIGPMRRHEISASQGVGFDKDLPDLQDETGIAQSQKGHVLDLIIPILGLIVATIGAILYLGAQATIANGETVTIFKAFENTDVGASLCIGGFIGLVLALITVIIQRLALLDVLKTLWLGAKSMFGAILILVFAWTIGAVIKDMQTGAYLSSLIEGNIDYKFLPALLFILSGIMAFATGTSWGTFGIMLPIAGDMAGATELSLILPMLSAVLAGSVFGDHCSPISDTTILSSTGARCDHIAHVSTQLPYALAVALISVAGFLTLGFTNSLFISFAIATLVFALVCLLMSVLSKSKLMQANV